MFEIFVGEIGCHDGAVEAEAFGQSYIFSDGVGTDETERGMVVLPVNVKHDVDAGLDYRSWFERVCLDVIFVGGKAMVLEVELYGINIILVMFYPYPITKMGFGGSKRIKTLVLKMP